MPDDKKNPRPKHLVARKLLVAAVGVATVNYVGVVACGGKEESSSSSGQPPTSGNLPAPNYDAGKDNYVPPTSGNLPAPPPPDASDDADAGDAADADDDGG